MSTIPANDRLAARFIREWLFFAAALLMLGGVVGWSLYADRQELEDEERERLSRRAKMIDENISRQLFATNRALESIRRDLPLLKAQKDSTGLINDRLQALVEVMPGVRTLLVYDAAATVIATNRKELMGWNFLKREYVKVALQSRNPAMLHLSAPYTTALGAFAMTAVKVIADDRGQVVGMVGVTIDPDYFKTLLHSVIYAPDMRVSITHSDGRLFVIVPEQAGRQGQDLAQPGSFFTRHRDSGQQVTLLTGIACGTGDECMMALRTVKPADLLMDKTLVVSVARDLPAIFDVWRRDAYEKAMLFGLAALVAGIGLFLGQRRRLAHERFAAASEFARQGAENALRESRELLVYAFNKSPLMNTLSDLATGKYLEVNDSFCRISEFSREEAVGKTAIELGWISKDERMRMVQEMQQTGWVNGMELALRSKNGQSIIGRYWGTVIRSTQGGDKLFSAAEDITERKQADYLFRESEKKYRVLLSNLSAGVVVHNADTSVLLANATAGSLLGLTEEQILGKTAMDPYWCFLHDDGAPMPLKDYPVNQVLTSGAGLHNLIVGVQRPDRAEPRWLLCNASPMRDETDNIVQVVVTFIDITERKQAEAHIRESEQRRESEHAAALEAQRLAGLAALNLMEDAVAARARAEAAAAALARLSRLYATLSQSNVAIVRCDSEDALFPQICRDAVNFGGMKMAWIGLVEATGDKVIPVASFGDASDYVANALISMDAENPRGHGPTATAIREDHPVWCQDFLHDPHTELWRERGARAGWMASASLPLHRGGVTVGALTLYAGDTNFFDDAIRKLLIEMAADISFAMDSYAAVAERKRAAVKMGEQLDELRRWQQVTLGREGRVLAMKKEVNSLLAELGQPPRYTSTVDAEAEKRALP